MMRTFGVTDHKVQILAKLVHVFGSWNEESISPTIQNEHMRRITQFHMTNWTDEGLCDNPKAIMQIIDEVFLIQRRTGNKPIVIHGV